MCLSALHSQRQPPYSTLSPQLLKAQHGGHHITYDATQAETDRLFEQAMLRKKALSLVELQNRKWLKMHKMHVRAPSSRRGPPGLGRKRLPCVLTAN